MARKYALGPFPVTEKDVAPIKRERRKRAEARRQVQSGKPLSPGAAYQQQRQTGHNPNKTNKTGKRLTARKRQRVRERELAQVYLGRRRLTPNLDKGPVKPIKPTVSSRKETSALKKHARESARQERREREGTVLGIVPVLGAATTQARKELEGHGALAGTIRTAKKHAGGPLAAWASPLLAGAKAAGVPGAKDVSKVLRNAIDDLIELPAQAAPSVYMPAKAAVKAVTGDTKEIKKLASDYAKGSAVALLAQGKVKEAGKAAVKHPVYTALELRGIKAVGGRSAGAAMRAVPGTTRRMASTKRQPLKIHGNIKEQRSYSKDVLTKAAQVANEKRKARKGIDPHQATPRKVARALNRRVDEEVAAVEGTRRANRGEIIKAWEGKNAPHPATPFVVQGIARRPDTMLSDLAAYRAYLKAQGKSSMSKAERAANRQMIQQVGQAIKKGTDTETPFKQAKAYKKAHAPAVSKLVKKSDLEAGQVRMARLIPYARLHMGAKWDKKGSLSPAAERHAAAQAAIKDAEVTLRKAQRQHEAARRKSAYAHGAARDPVTKAEGELLRADHRYRKAQNEFRTASQKLSRAKRAVRATEGGEVKTRYGRTLTKIGDPEKHAKWKARVPALQQRYDAARENLKVVRSRVVAEDAQRRVARQYDPEYKGGSLGYAGLDRVVYESRVAAREAKSIATDPQYSPAAQRRAWLAHRRAKVAEAEAIDELRALGYRVPPRGSERVFEAGRLPRRKVTQLDNKRAHEAGTRGEVLAARKRLKDARKEAREAYVPKPARQPTPGLVGPSGKPLTAGQIERHMLENKVPIPGFISQRPNMRGAANYYINFQTPKHRAAGKTRTGEATLKGTFDASPETLSEQLVRSQGLVDAIEGFDRTIKTFGIRPQKGKYFKDFDEARRFADDAKRDHAGNVLADSVELVPVRIAPFAANKSTLAKIKRGHESTDSLEALADVESAARKVSGIVDEALRPGSGPVVLVPKVVMNRLREHAQVAGSPGGKAVGAVSTAFKTTVLPTSTKWLTGNVADISMRALNEGIGPIDVLTGRKLHKALKKADPEAAKALEVRALGGTHMSSVSKTAKHREAAQFAGTKLEGLAQVLGTVRRTPGVKQAVDLYKGYASAVFKLNSKMERTAQYGALGKLARDQVREVKGTWSSGLRLGPKVVEELAQGLAKTDTQVAYGRLIDRIYGQWDKNSPAARRFLIDYAPFGQWLRASTTYVLVTFPKHHPIKAGVLAGLTSMTEDERKKLGLTKIGKDGVPGFLQGAVPTDKGLVPFGGYSSFGMFNQLPENVAGMFLPWLPLEQLRGLNFKGQRIRNADGSELTDQQRVALAAYSMLEAVLPLTALGRRLQEGGGTSTDLSTIFKPKVKEGTKGDFSDALNKVFNPFRPMSDNTKTKSAKGFDWSKVQVNPQSEGQFDWSKVVVK